MKNIIFIKNKEFNLETVGEKWRQGETVSGTLKVKNNGSDISELNNLTIALLSGNYKKVKAQDPKAFESILKTLLVEKINLHQNEECSYQFKFSIPDDCRITDKDGSVYLAYFENNETVPVGNLELTIQPKIMMMQFLEIMDNFLRFKIGPLKFNKGFVEVKLTPPTSKEFSQVDSLLLKLKESNKTLTLEYHFTTRKIEMNGGAMTTGKALAKFDQIMTPKEFYIYGDSVNQDGIIALVNSILNEIKPKFLM
jgi:hypothetical protein